MAKLIETKTTIGDAASSAFSMIEELAEEMREAFDNTPESLQSSAVGEARGEAADTLEGISEVDVPEFLADIAVVYSTPKYGKRGPSRRQRRDEAVTMLDACTSVLEQEIPEAKLLEIIQEHKDQSLASLREAIEELASELTNAKDEADGVEFPGMFG